MGSRVARQEFFIDFALDRQITEQYRKWLANAGLRLKQLELQKESGSYPDIANEYRERVEAAKELLALRARAEAAALARYAMLHEE